MASYQNYHYARKQENMIQNEEKHKSIETYSGITQVVKVGDNPIKIVILMILNVFKKVMEM